MFSSLNHLCDIDYFFAICGDFNLANIDWKRGYDAAILLQHEACLGSSIVNNGLEQLVTESTRNNNTLDILIVNDPLTTCNVSVVPPFCTSDHKAVTWFSQLPYNVPI